MNHLKLKYESKLAIRPRSEHSSSVPARSIFTRQTPCNEFVQSVRNDVLCYVYIFIIYFTRYQLFTTRRAI